MRVNAWKEGDEYQGGLIQHQGKKMRNSDLSHVMLSEIRVIDSTGACPMGFMEESTWDMDETGRFSFPMCSQAINVLNPIILKLAVGRDFDTRAQCDSPLTGCRVTFVVHTQFLVPSLEESSELSYPEDIRMTKP